MPASKVSSHIEPWDTLLRLCYRRLGLRIGKCISPALLIDSFCAIPFNPRFVLYM